MGYGSAIDIWSIGVMAYECLVGVLPFKSMQVPGRPMQEYMRDMCCRALWFPGWVSTPARNFVALCLTLNATKRPTVEQLMEHPWLAAR